MLPKKEDDQYFRELRKRWKVSRLSKEQKEEIRESIDYSGACLQYVAKQVGLSVSEIFSNLNKNLKKFYENK